MLLLSSADFYQNQLFFLENSFRNTIKVVGSLSPNCLQMLSADDKMLLNKKEFNRRMFDYFQRSGWCYIYARLRGTCCCCVVLCYCICVNIDTREIKSEKENHKNV